MLRKKGKGKWKKGKAGKVGAQAAVANLKNLLHDVVIEDIIDFKTTKIKEGYETEINKFISDRLIQKIGEFNQKGNLQSVAKGKKFNPINISEEGLELIELIALDCENTEGQWHSTTEIKIGKLGLLNYERSKIKKLLGRENYKRQKTFENKSEKHKR